MRHIKSIHEFQRTNEQLFRGEADAFARIINKEKGDEKSTEKISTEKIDIGDYGKLTKAKSSTSPLVVVFGGKNYNGKKSGEYMYDYFGRTGDSINLFITKDDTVDGSTAYKKLKSNLSDKSISPSKKILYLFSEGSLQGKDLLEAYSPSEFDIIYLVDPYMGNKKTSDYYTKIAINNKEKVRFFYTPKGSENEDATNQIIKSINYYKLNGNNDHMDTNTDAVSDLISKI